MFKLNKKQELVLIYFLPVMVFTSLFSGMTYYYYNSGIQDIDETLSELAFEYDPLEGVISERDWETLSMQDIDKKLINEGIEPIGDPEDLFYKLTPEQIDSLNEEEYEKLETLNYIRIESGFSDTVMINSDLPELGYEILEYDQFKELQNKVSLQLLVGLLIGLFFMMVFFAGLAIHLAKKALEPLEESLRKQKRFVSDAAHELRTPLALIKTEAEVLKRSKKLDTNEFIEFLDNTITDVNYLDKLTNNLLRLAEFDGRRNDIELEEVDVELIINKISDKFEKSLEEYGIRFEKESEKLMFKGNSMLLEQALSILVENSMKYRSDNSPWIKILCFRSGKDLIIQVKDNGVGINKKDIQNVFDRFYRASEDRNAKGHGLGLSIFKEICASMQIDIEIESQLEIGTTISMKMALR